MNYSQFRLRFAVLWLANCFGACRFELHRNESIPGASEIYRRLPGFFVAAPCGGSL
jgi:hypothetical protein